MKKFVALYREQDNGTYTLHTIFSRDFLEDYMEEDWLENFIRELSGDDLWAIHRVESDSKDDFTDILEEV